MFAGRWHYCVGAHHVIYKGSKYKHFLSFSAGFFSFKLLIFLGRIVACNLVLV